MTVRKLAVTYTLTVEPEDIPFRGNCSAIDPETDKAQEQWIADQLKAGNGYAWCWARVVASVDGFKGEDSFGGISCRDQADFERTFLPELRRNALADLHRVVGEVADNAVREAQARAEKARKVFARLPRKVKET